MPQFDPNTFLPQLFWLLVTFGLLYVVLGRALLPRIAGVLEARKTADPSSSYVSGLYARGEDAILKKIGEEAAELIIAGKNADSRAVIHETADLWFHSMVLLAAKGLGRR